jgi:predicted metallopeptidase
MDDQEKAAQDVFDTTMSEIVNEAAGAKDPTDADAEHRGDSAYTSKDEFGKKTTYIPSDGHSVWKLLADAKELCTESSNLDAMNVEIGITFVYPNISKRVYAHILKPNRLLKMHTGLPLIMEISGAAWDKMTEVERMALLHHELEHIHFAEKRNGDLDLKLIDHNIKDFANILDLYGIHYIRAGLNED